MKPVFRLLAGLCLLMLCFGTYATAVSITYTYDSAGRLTHAGYGSSKVISYTYDNNGNLTQQQVETPSSPAPPPAPDPSPPSLPYYTLTYTAGENGSIEGQTTQSVESGSSGTPVTAVPDIGYQFVKWSDGLTSKTRTDTNVTANISVTASFSIANYVITATAGTGGSISPSQVEVKHGDAATFDITVQDGYTIESVTGCDGTLTDTTYTTGPITQSCTVTAQFLAASPRLGPGSELGFDLNADGNADIILFNRYSRDVIAGLMDGMTILQAGYLFTLPDGWDIVGLGQWNGCTGLVLRHSEEETVYLIFVQGLSVIGYDDIGELPHPWQIYPIADLYGNRDFDLVLRHPQFRDIYVAYMNGTIPETVVLLGTLGDSEEILFPADLTGDGKAELVIRDMVSGSIYMAEAGAEGWIRTFIETLDPDFELISRGYYNLDATADLLFGYSVTGQIWTVLMNGITAQSIHELGVLPMDWQIIQSLDINGDQLSDLMLQHDPSGLLGLVLIDETGVVDIGTLLELTAGWEVVK